MCKMLSCLYHEIRMTCTNLLTFHAIVANCFYIIVFSYSFSVVQTWNIFFKWQFGYGTIHLRRQQIFTIFDPYLPTIGIPAKCLWRGFLILMYCDLLTVDTWGYPSPLRHDDVLNGWSLMYPSPLRHADVLNGWSLMWLDESCLGIKSECGLGGKKKSACVHLYSMQTTSKQTKTHDGASQWETIYFTQIS